VKDNRQKLTDYLEIEGWDIARVYTEDLEWWADEVWALSSRWSPQHFSLHITFLVDPQWEGNRKKGKAYGQWHAVENFQ
jgi:hypothetical protein